jgi:hypothetical protein
MRRILSYFVVMTCILGMLSCKMTPNQAKESEKDTLYQEVDIVPPSEELPKIISTVEYDYINSVKGHVEEEIIVGNFTGKGEDTLKVYAANHYYQIGDEHFDEDEKIHHSYIFSSNPHIPQLNLYYNILPSLVNEGDLDGNGTTEVGVLDTWVTSSCRMYRIYTLKNGRWVYLIEPIDTAENLRASGLELAEATGIKGKVKIRYSDYDAPLACCAKAAIKDTIVTASYLPIESLLKD